MDVTCEHCGQPIGSTDWESNNVKQLSVGLVHAECPNKLLIANCPNSMSIELLRKLFSPYGTVIDASINDVYGLIEYDNKESIPSAINAMNAMNGFEMGSNKLSVKMYTNVLNKNEQQNQEKKMIIKPDKSQQYRFNKEALSAYNAKEIASLLVPNSKIYKTIYKEWMQLIIQHKEEVIEFMYYSKANDINNEKIFKYISIPHYLKSMVIFKKDIDAANYVKNEARSTTLPSQHIIIVYGYIRKIEKKLKNQKIFIIPSIIIKLCFNFYISITKIFFTEHNAKLIEFELSDGAPKKTMIVAPENRLKIRDMISCICIPDLISSNVPLLQYWVDPNISYYGIFGRDENMHQFILREKINDEESYYMSFPAPNHLHLEKYADYVYCGKYGIIISDLDGLFQLKLKEINTTKDYRFTRLCYTWEWNQSSYLTMCYMKGLDKILAVQCNEETIGYSAKCAIFDFKVNQWKSIDSLNYLIRDQLYNNANYVVYQYEHVFCDMVYNYHDRSSVYLLSGSGILSQYDINKNKWNYLFGSNNFFQQKPVLWMDHQNTNILYHASLSRHTNYYGSKIDVKYTDLRSNKEEWFVSQNWNNLTISQSNFVSSRLFK